MVRSHHSRCARSRRRFVRSRNDSHVGGGNRRLSPLRRIDAQREDPPPSPESPWMSFVFTTRRLSTLRRMSVGGQEVHQMSAPVQIGMTPPACDFHGAAAPRGLEDVPHSALYEGFFGRMFRSLP